MNKLVSSTLFVYDHNKRWKGIVGTQQAAGPINECAMDLAHVQPNVDNSWENTSLLIIHVFLVWSGQLISRA